MFVREKAPPARVVEEAAVLADVFGTLPHEVLYECDVPLPPGRGGEGDGEDAPPAGKRPRLGSASSGPVKPLRSHKLSSPPCPSAASPWSLSQSWQRPPAPVRKLFSSSLLTLHRLVLSRLLCAAGDDGATADDGAVPLQQAAALQPTFSTAQEDVPGEKRSSQ